MKIGSITCRPLRRTDFPLFRDWLAAPHVRTWWPDEPLTVEGIEQSYGPCVDGTDPTRMFLVELDGEPVGMFQCYRHADNPDWDRAIGIPGAVGIDYLIGELDRCGKGLGTAAMAMFTSQVFELYPDVDTIVAAPQRANRASCRILEKTGFQLRYERILDSGDPADFGVSAVYALAR